MPLEPIQKRVIAFFDAQNLFHSAKEAFDYKFPNFDPALLALEIARKKGWDLKQVRFYTGVPDASDNQLWHHFWAAKLAVMGTRGVYSYTRPLRYRNQVIVLPDGTEHTILVGAEKGIDIRLALDMVRLALEGEYDIALLFSQDQDLSEAADEVRSISIKSNRWLKVACAFPMSPTIRNKRGINKTEWIQFDRALYDQCLDPNDYRSKKP
jgi:uncharacterized LabA/DUF88 family protein